MRKIIAGFVALAALALAVPSSPAKAHLPSSCYQAGSVCVHYWPNSGVPFVNADVIVSGTNHMHALCPDWAGQSRTDTVKTKDLAGGIAWGSSYTYVSAVNYGDTGTFWCVVNVTHWNAYAGGIQVGKPFMWTN